MASELSASPAADSNASTTIHVLVVDDCLIDRKVVEKLLTASLFKVTTVESGMKALEVLGLNEENIEKPSVNDQNIDIILTDYCMPGMDGYDLLMALKVKDDLSLSLKSSIRLHA